MVEQGWYATKYGHDHILFLHGYLQECEMVCKIFYVADVVEYVVIYVHFDGEGQIFGPVYIA